jgi:hypothetical protein
MIQIVYPVVGIVFMVVMEVAAILDWTAGYKIFGAWFLFAILHTLVKIESNTASEP